MLPLHLTSIAALALAALGGGASLLAWRHSGSTWPDDMPGAVDRSRMLATLGLGAAWFFLLMILTQWIPAFVLSPCWLT
jgi:hypothetical protein